MIRDVLLLLGGHSELDRVFITTLLLYSMDASSGLVCNLPGSNCDINTNTSEHILILESPSDKDMAIQIPGDAVARSGA